MLKNFQTYQLAEELFYTCEKLKLRHYMKEQLQRAALSIVLNLSEGSAKPTKKDQKKYYAIAYASCREVQSILSLSKKAEEFALADKLGGYLYRLVHN